MPLGLAVLLTVLGVTAVVAGLGCLIDKSAAAGAGESGDEGKVDQHT